MRVLITGAAGFLGRAFARHHIEASDEVTGVDNLSNPHSEWPDRLNGRRQEDAGDFFRISEGHRYDVAYHFAAPVGGRLKIEGDPMFNADSLRLDSLFFRWAIGRVQQVVYPSSSAVYGVAMQGADGIRLHETMCKPSSPVWSAPDEMYGFTKFAGEFLAMKSATYGLNTLCIRPFSGYGEEQSLDYPVPSIAQRAMHLEDPLVVWGSGYQTRDFIHVDDLVAATTKYPRTIGYEALNIATGVETSFVKVAEMCAQIAGYDPLIITDETKPEGVTRRFADPGRMLKYHTPEVDLHAGLERVMTWLAK